MTTQPHLLFQEFHTLQDDYQQTRNLTLTEGEFVILLCNVPVLLVGSSDYSLDLTEQKYMNDTIDIFLNYLSAKGTVASRINELRVMFLSEMEYLLVQLAAWERRMIQVLEIYLKEFPDLKNTIRDRMVGIATISKGVNVYEQKRLMDLCFKLNISLA